MEEMRAIRAILPKWRSDQKRQQEWQDALENKIDAAQKSKDGGKEKSAPRPPAAKPSAPRVFILSIFFAFYLFNCIFFCVWNTDGLF